MNLFNDNQFERHIFDPVQKFYLYNCDREYVICNFYICGKAGTATFRKG